MSDYETLLWQCEELLGRLQTQQDEEAARLASLRRDLSGARRAVGSLTNGSESMQEIGRKITDQLGEVERRVADAEGALWTTKTQRRRVERAAKLLRGGLHEGKSPTAAVVRPIVRALLEQNEGLTREEVYDLVLGKLEERGLGANGAGLRVNEALDDADYEADAAGMFRVRDRTPEAKLTPLPAATEGQTLEEAIR